MSDEGIAGVSLMGGCTDLAFDALDEVRVLVPSTPSRLPPSIDDRADPATGLSALEAMLGRLLAAVRLANSESSPPGPIDFLGGCLTTLLFDTGG